ncbi:Ras-related protein O-RAL [Echinococcus granulosus]|nr:Ras-related protein O-RAL [Echinococcus granulosus]
MTLQLTRFQVAPVYWPTVSPLPLRDKLIEMTQQQQQQNFVKLIVAGVGGVGKSALTLYFMYDEFVKDYEPTRADSYRKKISFGSEDVQLHILDTAGQEDYAGIRDTFYRNSEGFLLVFDLTDRQSFISLGEFVDQILRVKRSDRVPMLICGNKVDLTENRRVSQEEAEDFCRKCHVPYLETSAKTNTNVEKAFLTLAREVYQLKVAQRQQHQPGQPAKQGHKKKRCKIL